MSEPKLQVKELCLGLVTRLRYIKRFSVAHVQHIEAVAEHSFYTAWYCMLIGNALHVNGSPEAPNMEALLTRALIHDVDEAFSGDIIRMFHRDGGDLERLIHDRSGVMVRNFLDKVCNGDVSMHSILYHNWENAKDRETVEGCIVSYADFLSVLSYVAQEVDGGNRRLLDHLADIEEYAESFNKDSRFDFLWTVLEGHRWMVTWLKNELNTRRQG